MSPAQGTSGYTKNTRKGPTTVDDWPNKPYQAGSVPSNAAVGQTESRPLCPSRMTAMLYSARLWREWRWCRRLKMVRPRLVQECAMCPKHQWSSNGRQWFRPNRLRVAYYLLVDPKTALHPSATILAGSVRFKAQRDRHPTHFFYRAPNA